jgi:diadenosine tetraphosphate (Ap4A) HIT family hydrolase
MTPTRATPDCPFCNLPKERIWLQTETAIGVLDAFPVTEGHTLVIPRRHIVELFDLSEAELSQIWESVLKVRNALKRKYFPEGFTIGVNEGKAAGQTIAHAHVHVIPRRAGDVPDPRGGIRWVIPPKAKYW